MEVNTNICIECLPLTDLKRTCYDIGLCVIQIRDWLTLEEEMLRQQAVVVGDVEDIHQVLDKQKVSFPPTFFCKIYLHKKLVFRVRFEVIFAIR